MDELTAEAVDQLEAGPTLDALVARFVVGDTPHFLCPSCGSTWFGTKSQEGSYEAGDWVRFCFVGAHGTDSKGEVTMKVIFDKPWRTELDEWQLDTVTRAEKYVRGSMIDIDDHYIATLVAKLAGMLDELVTSDEEIGVAPPSGE